LIDWKQHGFTSHGPAWKGLMIRCGMKPNSSHRMDTSGLRKKPTP